MRKSIISVLSRLNLKKLAKYFFNAFRFYLLPHAYKYRIGIYNTVSLRKDSTFNDEWRMAKIRSLAHVLDKGLHRPDWEQNHSRPVYLELLRLMQECNSSDVTYDWAEHIVKEYDMRHACSPKSYSARCSLKHGCQLQPAEALAYFKSRTSCRHYSARKISKKTFDLIIEAALAAPCSSNRQTLKVYATLDPQKAIKILKLFKGYTCFSKIAPSACVFCADLRPYSFPAELFNPPLDIGLAVGNASQMAYSLGMSLTLLTWGARTTAEEQELRKVFEIPEYIDILAGAICGYPTHWAIKPVRKSLPSTVTYM